MANQRPIEPVQGGRPASGMSSADRPDQPPGHASLVERRYTITKRQKTAQACTACRRLRIRCDGQKPCQACLDSSISCTYGVELSSGRANRLTLASAARKIEELEQQLSVQRNQQPTPGCPGADRAGPPRPPIAVMRYTETEEGSFVHEIFHGVDRMRNATGHPEYFGSSSPTATRYLLKRSAGMPDDGHETHEMASHDRVSVWHSDRRQLQHGQSPEKVSAWLCRSLSDEYISCYFRTVHRVCPAIEPTHFMQRYQEYWQSLPTEGGGYTHWTAVMFMALALGHQFYHVSKTEDELLSSASYAHGGSACFKAGKDLLTDASFEGGDISTVNALFLAALWLYNEQRLHEAYITIGLSTRIAFAIGLHKDLGAPRQDSPEMNGWRATFWYISTLDRELAMTLGRPCIFVADETDLQPMQLLTYSHENQYVERTRQLMDITQKAFNDVHSVSQPLASVQERARTLQLADTRLDEWLATWMPKCEWAEEPYGILFVLRQSHLCMIHHRVFLTISHRAFQTNKAINDYILEHAARSVSLACQLIKTGTTSVNINSSGILLSSIFNLLTYLWDSSLTIMLCMSQPRLLSAVQQAKPPAQVNCRHSLDDAVDFLQRYAAKVPFAKVASHQVRLFLDKLPQHSLTPAQGDQGRDEVTTLDPGYPVPADSHAEAAASAMEAETFDSFLTDEDVRNWMSAPVTTMSARDGLGDDWAFAENNFIGSTLLHEWMHIDLFGADESEPQEENAINQ